MLRNVLQAAELTCWLEGRMYRTCCLKGIISTSGEASSKGSRISEIRPKARPWIRLKAIRDSRMTRLEDSPSRLARWGHPQDVAPWLRDSSYRAALTWAELFLLWPNGAAEPLRSSCELRGSERA